MTLSVVRWKDTTTHTFNAYSEQLSYHFATLLLLLFVGFCIASSERGSLKFLASMCLQRVADVLQTASCRPFCIHPLSPLVLTDWLTARLPSSSYWAITVPPSTANLGFSLYFLHFLLPTSAKQTDFQRYFLTTLVLLRFSEFKHNFHLVICSPIDVGFSLLFYFLPLSPLLPHLFLPSNSQTLFPVYQQFLINSTLYPSTLQYSSVHFLKVNSLLFALCLPFSRHHWAITISTISPLAAMYHYHF